VYRWFARRREVSREAFHAAVSSAAHALTERRRLDSPVQITVNHRLEDPLPIELPEPGADAVLALDFQGLESARAFLSDQSAEAAWVKTVCDHAMQEPIQILVAFVCVVHDEFSFQPTMMQPKAFSWR
jgi:hypothetical protein